MSRKQKLVIIVGPTASGKSELAIRLAKKFNGEVISADSRQIYRGLNVGTGKVKGMWRKKDGVLRFIYKNVPHYCIDVASPKKAFTVAEYQTCAKKAIRDITGREKLPILCGGTGFWITAVVHNLRFPEVPPNFKLRRRLEKKSIGELLHMLKNLDPMRAKTVEQKNPRRIIRAIEIAYALGRTPKIKQQDPYRTLWIGVTLPPQRWLQKMQKRIRTMIRHGLVEETKELLEKGVSKKRIQELGFEYQAALLYRDKKINKEELFTAIVKGTQHYARRQVGWWKRNQEIRWSRNPQYGEGLVKRFIAR